MTIRSLKLYACLTFAFVVAGCGTFYNSPGRTSAGVDITEKSTRKGLGWHETFEVSTIDGKPASHMGTSLGSATVRVTPGIHKIVFSVRYIHSVLASDVSGAEFPLVISLIDGDSLALNGIIDSETSLVTFWLESKDSGRPLFPALRTMATPMLRALHRPTDADFLLYPRLPAPTQKKDEGI